MNTSESLALEIFASIENYLGEYKRRNGTTLKAFWYYGKKYAKNAPLSAFPPKDWKVTGLEVLIPALPDLGVQQSHGTTKLETVFTVTVIPHGNDLSNVQETVLRIAEALDAESINLIPENKELKVRTQYQLLVRK